MQNDFEAHSTSASRKGKKERQKRNFTKFLSNLPEVNQDISRRYTLSLMGYDIESFWQNVERNKEDDGALHIVCSLPDDGRAVEKKPSISRQASGSHQGSRSSSKAGSAGLETLKMTAANVARVLQDVGGAGQRTIMRMGSSQSIKEPSTIMARVRVNFVSSFAQEIPHLASTTDALNAAAAFVIRVPSPDDGGDEGGVARDASLREHPDEDSPSRVASVTSRHASLTSGCVSNSMIRLSQSPSVASVPSVPGSVHECEVQPGALNKEDLKTQLWMLDFWAMEYFRRPMQDRACLECVLVIGGAPGNADMPVEVTAFCQKYKMELIHVEAQVGLQETVEQVTARISKCADRRESMSEDSTACTSTASKLARVSYVGRVIHAVTGWLPKRSRVSSTTAVVPAYVS
eukprot:TRINITY_DN26767_c0_g1_i1.p1 TRINITY_DN26767_c0_g1~~TRINITY_DN26767_c0_g1_i1.p1  ORF type:complete len:404 (-),score=83.67 TRINITY_DN26767_c0_g1_i1:9-1220(-)